MRLAGMAARRQGIKDPIQPLRTGANHVFRAGDVVVRVAPQSADVSGQVALARWLVSEGFPVAAPLADADVVGGAKLSLWEYIQTDERRPIDFEQLGEVVARLHRVAPARLENVVALPFCGDAAWLAVEQNLALAEAANVVEADGLAALRRECVALRDWHDRARRELLVVCHGDVHPKNVLMRGDDVVIIDWDAICIGPRAWDHAALMTSAERWGGAAETYSDFARGYGADLCESSLAQELAALRLLAPTINMIINGASNRTYAAEAQARILARRSRRSNVDAPLSELGGPLEGSAVMPERQTWSSHALSQWTKSDSGERPVAHTSVQKCSPASSRSLCMESESGSARWSQRRGALCQSTVPTQGQSNPLYGESTRRRRPRPLVRIT